MRFKLCGLALGLLASLSVGVAQASVIAFDNAANALYASNWTNGSNGGTGWASGWTLQNGANSGFFTFTSSQNGSGSSGNIDTGGRSWGMYANAPETADALRDFTGALSVGQQFSVDLDNGFLNGGANAGTVGFGLQNIAGGNNRLEFYFVGGGSDYRLNDASGDHGTGIPFTADGLHIAVTLTGTNTYSAVITPNGGSPSAPFTGTLGGTAGSGIDRVRLFDFNSSNGAAFNPYFNSIAITPEPASIGVLGLAVAALARRSRRR